MTNFSNLIVKLLGIIIGIVAIVAAIYIWILPIFFHGYKTYAFLVMGAITAAFLGGYFCYKATNALMSPTSKYFISSFGGIIVASLVVLLSLLIIVNTKGA